MKGYIVNLYKYGDEKEREISAMQDWAGVTVYGEYDRMSISSVSAFHRFHDVGDETADWKGKSQRVLLYEIEGDGESGDWHGDLTKSCQAGFPFIALTSLSFEGHLNCTDYPELLERVKKGLTDIIDSTLKKNNYQINYHIYGTLSYSGICIVWLSDQYQNIMKIVDGLKYIQAGADTNPNIQLFHMSYTVIASTNALTAAKAAQTKGCSTLLCTFKSGIMTGKQSVAEVVEDFKETLYADQGCVGCHIHGEYDFSFVCSASDNLGIFADGRDRLAYFNEKVLQSSLLLGYDKNDVCMDYKAAVIWLSDTAQDYHIDCEINKIDELYYEKGGIRQSLAQHFPKTAGVVDIFDWMRRDFISNFSSIENELWRADFYYQYISMLHVLKDVLEDTNNREKLYHIHKLSETFKKQVQHLSHSHLLSIELTSCMQSDTMFMDAVLHAFYGIIKDICQLVYSIPRADIQSEIVPLIRVSEIPEVKSALYYNRVDTQSNHDARRLVDFKLPKSMMTDLPRSIFYLLHEVFHYSAPRDRTARNYFLGAMMAFLFMKDFFTELMVDACLGLWHDNFYHDSEIIYTDKFVERIRNAMLRYYNMKDYFNKDIYRFARRIAESYEHDLKKDPLVNDLLETEFVEQFTAEFAPGHYASALHGFLDDFDYGRFCNLMELNEKQLEMVTPATLKQYLQKAIDSNDGFGRITRARSWIKLARENYYEALHEWKCDICMLEISGATLDEYLLYMTDTQLTKAGETFKTKQKSGAPLDSYIRDCIRLCEVTRFLRNREKEPERQKQELVDYFNLFQDSFIERYCVYYNSSLKTIADLRKDASVHWQERLKMLYFGLNQYTAGASVFFNLIGEQITLYHDEVDSEFEDFRKKYSDFFAEQRRIDLEFATVLTGEPEADANASIIRDAKERHKQGTFALNLGIVLHFQTQKPLQKLFSDITRPSAQKAQTQQHCAEVLKTHLDAAISSSPAAVPAVSAKTFAYEVRSIRELFYITDLISRSLDGDIWYRGQKNSEWGLCCSLARAIT